MEAQQYRYIEQSKEVYNHLKELEQKRLKEDVLNVDKNKALYEVYKNLLDSTIK